MPIVHINKTLDQKCIKKQHLGNLCKKLLKINGVERIKRKDIKDRDKLEVRNNLLEVRVTIKKFKQK